MIPTKKNLGKLRGQTKKSKVHQKIANTFIENAISKNNLSTLKTIYYLSTVLQELDLSEYKDDQTITIKIDKRSMLKFTELSVDTVIKTTKQMQETSITFYDEEVGSIEGMSLLPRYYFIPNKNVVELDLYTKIAKMIIDVKNNYTPMNIKDLMHIKNKHSLRLLALLCKLSNEKEESDKRMDLEELRAFFGVNYKTWGEFERKIIKPVKDELDNTSKLSFSYEANYENLGRGRPAFKNIKIDLIKNTPQGRLF